MDDRQQNIEVGAGLQESRINQELLDWLNKWGSWILTGVLIVVLAYLGYIKYQEYQANQRDTAFAAYMTARGIISPAGVLNGSPDNLLTLADEKTGIGAVSNLARLDAAEIYLGWARLGLATGAISDANLQPAPADILSAEQEADLFTRAYDLFKRVAADTSANDAQSLLHLKAQWGMAASSVSLDEFDRAAQEYESARAFAETLGMPDLVASAERSISKIENWKTPLAVYPESELPPELRPIDPTAASPARPVLDDAFQSGVPVRIGPDDTLFEAESEVVPADSIEGEPAGDPDDDSGQ